MEWYENIELVQPNEGMVDDIIKIRSNINTANDYLDYDNESEYKTMPLEILNEIAENETSKSKIWKIIQVNNGKDNTTKNIGFVLLYLSRLKRRCHVAEFSIGIIDDECHHGYGKEAINKAINLAKDNKIKVIKLTVDTRNKRAISLYMSVGFVICGFIKNSKFVKGEYRDEYLMTLTI